MDDSGFSFDSDDKLVFNAALFLLRVETHEDLNRLSACNFLLSALDFEVVFAWLSDAEFAQHP